MAMLGLHKRIVVASLLAVGCSGDTSGVDEGESSTDATGNDDTTSTGDDAPAPDLGDGSESEGEGESESESGSDTGDDEGSPDGLDCPSAAPPAEPTDSPRVLIIAPAEDAAALATHLQGIMDADPELRAPEVVAAEQELGSPNGLANSMAFFYNPDGREDRLALLAEPWTY